MPKCMVDGCCNRQSRSGNKGNFMLHRFPTSKKTIKSWLIATGRDFDDIDSVVQNVIESRKFGTYRMCSQHFDDHCYVNTGKQRILKANSVPTIFHYKKSMGNKVSNTPIPEDTPSTSASDAQSVAPSTKQSVSATIGLLTDVINEQPRKRKRFMDHDYTEESEHYAFAKFVSEGCNTECVPTKDKSSSTGERFARRSIKLQTQPSLFSANVKTTTRDLIMVKNCGTMTDDLIWPGISNFTPGGQTQVKSQQKKPHSTLTKAKLKTPKVFRRPFSLCSTPIKEKTTVPNIEESGCAEDDRDLQFDIDQTMHEESGHEVDPTYCPSTLTDSYLGELSFLSEPTPEDFVAEQKFLVFESALDELLRKITNCSYKGCSAFIVERKKKITGTLLTVKGVLLGMPFIHKTTHYDYQKEYFFPVIDKHYQADHESNIRDLKGEPVCVCGDGQCDSPGHSAKYCTYTMMDEETNKILDCNTVQVSEATSSSAMEATAFKQTMAKLKDDGVKIAMLATDRHVTIRSLMAKLFKSIEHQFDVWHFCKSLFQKLRALCRKRKCKEITAWCRSIVNHIWTCCATSQGNVGLLKERWNSILHHIVGEHSWDNGCLVSGCAHDPIDAGVGRPKKWLKKDSVAFGELSKLVLDKKLQKDLDHLAEFCHTGNLEIFHSLVLKYRPKRVHFGMDAMVARTRLAVLAHNNNVNKTQATVQNVDGTESVDVNRYKAYFCKRNKQWMIKKIYNANTISHIYPMLADVIRHASGELTSQWVSKNKSYPKNVATVPCPVKADLVDKHRSRFK